MYSKAQFLCTQHGRKGLFALIAMRKASTSSPEEATPQRINSNIFYRPNFRSRLPDTERPIVLLYGWLVAKSRHMYKYGDYYLGKGFDVIHVKVKPEQLLRPTRAQAVVEQVLEFVSHSDRASQPILYHGFSAGGYLFGETLVKINDQPDMFRGVGKRIKGQIFDSPVEVDGIPNGVSQAVSDNPVLQKMIFNTLQGYLQFFYESATKHYNKSSAAAKANELNTPSLFLYSKSDLVAPAEAIDERIKLFVNRGLKVHAKCFDNSLHVAHFQQYPMEYIMALNLFLQDINLVAKEINDKEQLHQQKITS